jgi:signal transduction histidine kinase
LRVKATDLVALAEQVAEAQRGTSDRHRIVVDAPDRLDGEWDADRVSQVLANQVANAIKYSPRGGDVAIMVRREGDRAVVSISDRGIGIRADDLALLFQPFSRLYTEERASGAGLGLYISRGIVQAHGGRIEAASEGLGEGSTFTVTLPLGRPA